MSAPLLIATENVGKLNEFQRLLGDLFTCTTSLDPSLPRKQLLQVVEDGDTYYENALIKAIGYFRTFRVAVLADDSGLEVDVLNGAPGVFTSRFGGESLGVEERWKFLHQSLAPFPEDTWIARFRSVLCYYDGVRVPVFFEGTTEGRILPGPLGKEGFGYDPIFYSSSLKKGFGEASAEEKQNCSHRAVATRQFLTWFARSGS